MAVDRTNLELTATDKTAAAFASVRRSLGSMAKLVGGAFAIREITRFGSEVIDTGDKLAKMSSKLGVSVEKLSEFRVGANLANTDVSTLERSMAKLAGTVQDAVNNPLTDQARLFRELGVNITDSGGKIRSLDGIMQDIGDRFSAAADDTNKTIAAVKLFGKSGAELIPFLNTLRATGDEARRSGKIFSTEFAQAAENFNDSFTRIKDAMVAFAANSSAFRGIMDGIVFIFRSAASLALTFAKDVEVVGRSLGALGAAVGALVERDWGRVKAIYAELKADIIEIDERTTTLIEGIWEDHGEKVKEIADKSKPSLGINTEASEELKRLLADLRKSTEQANLALLTDDAERARKSLEIDRIAIRSKIDLAQISVAERQQVENAYLEWLKARETQAFRESRTPFETLLDNWTDTTTQMREKTAEWAQDAADKLTEFAMTGKLNFKNFAQSIIQDLVRIRIQEKLVSVFNATGRGSLFSGMGKFFSGIFGGGLATGGPVTAGTSYLVGERGPELFTPSTSGFITPNGASGGITQHITVDARGADRGVEARIRQAMVIAKDQAKAELIQEVESGGRIARVFGR